MTRLAFNPSGTISRPKETIDWRISSCDAFVIFAPVAGFIYFTFPARRIAREQPDRGIKRHRRFMIAVQKDSIFRRYYGRFCEVTTTLAESSLEPFCRRRQPSQPKQDAPSTS